MRTLTLIFLVACTGKPGETTDTAGDPADADTDADSDTDTDADSDTDTDTTDGACGAVTTHEVVILGSVIGIGGGPSAGHIILRDRGWNIGAILGEGPVNDAGFFQITGHNITSTEDCWGTLLDYWLEVDRDPTYYGEVGINTLLYNAIIDGTLYIDMTSLPIQLEDTSR